MLTFISQVTRLCSSLVHVDSLHVCLCTVRSLWWYLDATAILKAKRCVWRCEMNKTLLQRSGLLFLLTGSWIKRLEVFLEETGLFVRLSVKNLFTKEEA